MKIKRPVSIARRYGMRTRINPATWTRGEVERRIRETGERLMGRDDDDEFLRQMAMRMMPDQEELQRICEKLPKTDFDYDEGVDEAY